MNYPSNINSTTVSNLKLSWSYNTESYVTGKPLTDDGKVYAYDWYGYLYCLDLDNGKERYKKRLYQAPEASKFLKRIPIVNKYLGEKLPYMWNGFAGTGCISNNKIYLASVGGKPGPILKNGAPGEFFAVDASNGEILGRQKLAFPKYSGSISTLLMDNRNVYVGVSSIEEAVEPTAKLLHQRFTAQSIGKVIAYNKETFLPEWQRKTIGLLEGDVKSAKGAGVWGGFAIDSSNHTLYFGTGNNYTLPPSKSSDSIIALNSRNGNLKWQYQAIVGDSWLPNERYGPDYDFGSVPILFNDLIGIGNKNGYFYALKKDTGQLIWKTYCNVENQNDDGIRSKASYKDGRIYVWSKNERPEDTITICCLNAKNGEVIWHKTSVGTNAMSNGEIINDLYFVPNYIGEINAFRLSDGELVWTGRIPRASIGSSICCEKDRIIVGTGVPKLYGGNPNIYGVYSFSL